MAYLCRSGNAVVTTTSKRIVGREDGEAFTGRRWPQVDSETSPSDPPDRAGSAMTRPFTQRHRRDGAGQVPYLADATLAQGDDTRRRLCERGAHLAR
jgi:hypothetical protein